jgi:hypothetical protein
MIRPTSEHVESLLRQNRAVSNLHIFTHIDYQVAREHALIALNYDPISAYSLSGTRKQRIGNTKPQKCRYCTPASGTTFKFDAHAVPECLGNRTLISDDECDGCNDLFSRTFEHHLDLMTRPWRTLFGIKGKRNKVPTFRVRSGTTRIDNNPQTRRIRISDPDGNIRITEDYDNKRRTKEVPCDPFIPIEVFRAFTKIGLAILPSRFFIECEPAFKWLRAPLEDTPGAVSRFAMCWMFYSPVSFQNPIVELFRRRSSTDPLPNLICRLSLSNIIFLFTIPLSPRDDHWRLERLMIPRVIVPLPSGLEPNWEVLDLRERELRADFKYYLNIDYERSSPISKEEFEAD